MDLIRAAIDRPIAVLAVVIMAVLFGVLALTRIPVQLAPDVRKPIVVVETNWAGAAPAEVEREIINPQEDAFRGLEGLEIMTSRARTGRAEVTLEFAVGSDMGDILLLVSNRLDRVGAIPPRPGSPRSTPRAPTTVRLPGSWSARPRRRSVRCRNMAISSRT